MSGILTRLLHPLTRADFFEHYWSKRHLHLARDREGYFDDVVRLADIDVFFQSEMNAACFFNVVRSGEHVGIENWSRVQKSDRGATRVAVPEQLLSRYAEGATLILNHAHKTIPPIGRLVRRLKQELEFETSVNIYITPPAAQGFARHADPHEVLVLQLTGTKSWSIYGDDNEVEIVQVRPGDVLYIPRGGPHSAVCDDTPSVHITIGIKPWYGFLLLERMAKEASNNGFLSRPGPPAFAGEEARRQFAADFRRHLQDLAADVDVSRLTLNLHEHLTTTQSEVGIPRLLHMLEISKIRASTTVQRSEGLRPVLERNGADIKLLNAHGNVTVPAYLEAVFEQALNGRPFQVGDLKGLITPQGKLELVQKLVAGGFLSVIATDQ